MGEMADLANETSLWVWLEDIEYVLKSPEQLTRKPSKRTWKWKTGDNQRLKLKEISDTHLKNIINYLKRISSELKGSRHPQIITYWKKILIPWLREELYKRKHPVSWWKKLLFWR